MKRSTDLWKKLFSNIREAIKSSEPIGRGLGLLEKVHGF